VSGVIVLLNGAPRSGKSSIARAVQARLDGLWINLGVDVAMAAQPPSVHAGIGLKPGGQWPDLERHVPQLYGALFDAIAAYASNGVNVVSDLGIHDDYSKPLGVLPDAANRLAGLPVLFVGVAAPMETIMARRTADTRGGYYSTDEKAVRRWQEAPHAHGIYDLRIDSSKMSPEDGAAEIGRLIDNWPEHTAFEKIIAPPG
jgi:chloramphenicol 3-O phosphotransferase